MLEDWTFGRRLAIGFGLAGLTLLVIAFVAFRTTDSLIDNNALVAQSYNLRAEFADLLSELKDAETGQRGFVITGNEQYLAPYQAALSAIKATFEDLRRLTAGSADQQRRLAAMSPLIESKLAELRKTIELRRSGGFEPSAKEVETDVGKVYMDQVRAMLAEADRGEAAQLVQRAEEASASARLAKAVTLWGGLSGVVAVALIGWFMATSLGRQIGTVVGQMQSSSAELQAAASQQATGAQQQATAMSEITTTISELLTTSRQIAESAQRVAQIADQTAGAARSGHGTVDTTQGSITGIRRQVDQIVGHMLDLGKKSQEIGSVLEIVAELAEQTNILAINATIEAAGAGDAGRRFAVVADEIRKLADRVGRSTKEIRTLIDDVRGAVNTTVMATETGSKAVDAGSRQFGDVAAGFNQISSLILTATEAAREIELSTRQQATAVEQVNLAIASVAQASRETETSSGQTAQTASQLATVSRRLLRVVRPQAAA